MPAPEATTTKPYFECELDQPFWKSTLIAPEPPVSSNLRPKGPPLIRTLLRNPVTATPAVGLIKIPPCEPPPETDTLFILRDVGPLLPATLGMKLTWRFEALLIEVPPVRLSPLPE